VSPSGAVATTPQACTGATTVIDAVTGEVIVGLAGG
jgi:hypothetical protein